MTFMMKEATSSSEELSSTPRISKKEKAKKFYQTEPESGSEGGESSSSGSEQSTQDSDSVIRCPCGDNRDKGLMIQCEICLVWQHSLCVGIREGKSVPEHYWCEICLPRNFHCVCGDNSATGRLIGCTQCNTWQHLRCLGKNSSRTLPKPYLCAQCKPEEPKSEKEKEKEKDKEDKKRCNAGSAQTKSGAEKETEAFRFSQIPSQRRIREGSRRMFIRSFRSRIIVNWLRFDRLFNEN